MTPEARAEQAVGDEPTHADGLDSSLEPQIADANPDELFLPDKELEFHVTQRVGDDLQVTVVRRAPQITKALIDRANANAEADGVGRVFLRWDEVDLNAQARRQATMRRQRGFSGLLRFLRISS